MKQFRFAEFQRGTLQRGHIHLVRCGSFLVLQLLQRQKVLSVFSRCGRGSEASFRYFWSHRFQCLRVQMHCIDWDIFWHSGPFQAFYLDLSSPVIMRLLNVFKVILSSDICLKLIEALTTATSRKWKKIQCPHLWDLLSISNNDFSISALSTAHIRVL